MSEPPPAILVERGLGYWLKRLMIVASAQSGSFSQAGGTAKGVVHVKCAPLGSRTRTIGDPAQPAKQGNLIETIAHLARLAQLEHILDQQRQHVRIAGQGSGATPSLPRRAPPVKRGR